MKSKSILSVWHTAYGSDKKKDKGHMHVALVIVALFTVGSAYAAKSLQQPGAPRRSPARPLTPAQRAAQRAATNPVSTGSAARSTEGGWKLVIELLMEPAPWTQEVQAKYDQIMTEGKFSQEQNAYLKKAYDEKLATYNRWGYQQQQSQWQQPWQQMQQTQQQPRPTFAVSQAFQGAKGVVSQGTEQAKGWYDWMKEKGYNWLGGNYVSGMGNAKYIAPVALGLAAGPVGLIAGALGLAGGTAALVTAGSGAAIWGFSNIMDRANFMALSGGHGTTEGWLKTLKEQLTFVLNNVAAYPYYLAKKEALNSTQELYPVESDPTGVIKQAHDALLAECNAKLAAMQRGTAEFSNEEQFVKVVDTIRNNNNYAQLTPDQYIANLRRDNDAFIEAQALVSEYNRALNRKSVQEIIAQRKIAATQAPMQQMVPEEQPTMAPITTEPVQTEAGPKKRIIING